MHFALTNEQNLVKETAKRFAEETIKPIARELEQPENRQSFYKILKQLSELGFMGMNIDEEFGGSNSGVIAFSVAITEIAKSCA